MTQEWEDAVDDLKGTATALRALPLKTRLEVMKWLANQIFTEDERLAIMRADGGQK